MATVITSRRSKPNAWPTLAIFAGFFLFAGFISGELWLAGFVFIVAALAALVRLGYRTLQIASRGRPRLAEWLVTIWSGLALIGLVQLLFAPDPQFLFALSGALFLWLAMMNVWAWAQAEKDGIHEPWMRLVLMFNYWVVPLLVVAGSAVFAGIVLMALEEMWFRW